MVQELVVASDSGVEFLKHAVSIAAPQNLLLLIAYRCLCLNFRWKRPADIVWGRKQTKSPRALSS